MQRIFYFTEFQADPLVRFRYFFTLMIMMMPVFSSQGHAQSDNGFHGETKNSDPTIVATAGGVHQVGDIQLQWTLGESFAGSAFTKHDFYTVGFHQPWIKLHIDFKADAHVLADVHVFPNPFTHFLKINIHEKVMGEVKLVITDLLGRAVFENNFIAQQDMLEMYIPDIPAGQYALHLMGANDVLIQRQIIIKSN